MKKNVFRDGWIFTWRILCIFTCFRNAYAYETSVNIRNDNNPHSFHYHSHSNAIRMLTSTPYGGL